ncbi:MAG: oligosaccharide flippase family protein [Candidatus Endonucleobacter bathymodioli]|uniref:Oligosaccharide flippase family protein n=1 Tax=Candidatus Endonucleibacter bathymodioli TaxID=539814 RepID=A0AA90NWD9_9GAMM|nr:oligosaccharide flippase family protein [Candidatus Endonucleobacter bathymodioli]
MINRLKPKSEFSRNILTLITGTTIAQAITVVISPILTRIYTPEDFGIFALYMSIVCIVATIATGQYEMAILLPKKDSDALHIVILSVLIAFIISLLILIIVFFFNAPITKILNNEEISKWLYFAPLSIFLIGLYQSLNYWFNRKKYYKTLAKNKILQTSSTASMNLTMGFSGLGSSGLLLSSIFGQIIAIFFLAKNIQREDHIFSKKINRTKTCYLAKKYINCPKFLIAAGFINTLSVQSPVLLLSTFYQSTVIGFYMLIQRIIGLPMSMIASSVADVFRQKASYEYAHNGECRQTYLVTFKKLFLLALIPFILFYMIAPDLFSFVLGKEWESSGEYAQLLTPMFFLQFITTPLANMFIVAEKQRENLYWQIFSLAIVGSSLLLGGVLFDDIKITFMFFSTAYSIAYVVNGIMSYKFSKGIE